MPDADRPSRKISATEFLARQVQDHLTSDAFRAQLYDIVRHVLAAQGHNLTLEDVRAVVREELDERPAPAPAASGLTPADVDAAVRLSVLSDDAADVGGAIDAKVDAAVRRVTAALETRITNATDELEEGLLAAIARRPAPAAAPAPAATGGRRPEGLESDISDALLQDIYRAVREEVATLRKTLIREARESAAGEVTQALAAQPPGLSEVDVRALAAAIVAEHEQVHGPRLTPDDVRAIVRTEVQAAEAAQPPRLDGDSVRGLAREVVDAALAQRPAALTPHDVRVMADTAIAEAAERAPAPLTAEDVARIARASVELPATLDAAGVQALIDRAIAALPAPVTTDDVQSIARRAAEEAGAGAGTPLDPVAIRQMIQETVLEVMPSTPGPTVAELQALIEDVLAARTGAHEAPAAADGPTGVDELTVRTLARTEMAEILSELPHPHTDEQIAALAAEAARAELAERLEHGEAPVTPSDVRRLAREILATEGATREELVKILRSDAPAPAVPADAIERAVQEQVAAVVAELGAGQTGGGESSGLDGPAVSAVVRSELERSGFMTGAEVQGLVRELLASQGGGGGGGGDLDLSEIKRMVREVVEARAVTRDEWEKFQRSGGTRRL